VFLVAFAALMMDPEIVFRVPPALPWVLRLPALIAIPAAALVSAAATAWAWGLGSAGERWSLGLTALAGAAFVGWLLQWNLLFYIWR
jgi:hypothetical protein